MPTTPDNYFEKVDKNCAMCLGLNTVVEHEANYICTECLYVSDEIEYCGWCGEGQIGGGSLESSHYSGCEFCEGQVSRMTNKLLILQVELVEWVVAPCVPLCVANNLSHA